MSDVLYEITRTRKQLSAMPVRMGSMCWVYILGFYFYDTYTGNNSFFTGDSKLIISVFIGASVIFFLLPGGKERTQPHTMRLLQQRVLRSIILAVHNGLLTWILTILTILNGLSTETRYRMQVKVFQKWGS